MDSIIKTTFYCYKNILFAILYIEKKVMILAGAIGSVFSDLYCLYVLTRRQDLGFRPHSDNNKGPHAMLGVMIAGMNPGYL